jgi:MFS family permease
MRNRTSLPSVGITYTECRWRDALRGDFAETSWRTERLDPHVEYGGVEIGRQIYLVLPQVIHKRKPPFPSFYFAATMSRPKEPVSTHLEHCNSTTTQVDAPQDPDADYTVGWRTVLAIFALALANCNATLSNTTNTIIRYQVIAVGGASEASWIGNGNFLMTLAFAPIFGSLSDRLGKKWFIVTGCLLGLVGSFISSSARDVYTIVGGNITVGIGNAGCIVSIAANQEIMSNKLRPYVFGFAQTINSIAAIMGTFLAADFAQRGAWAWSYRFNGIAYGVAGLLVLLTYYPPPTTIRRSTSLRDICFGIDYCGMLLLAGSVACLVTGLTWGGSKYAWHSGMIIGLLTGGCVGLVILGLFEWKVKTAGGLLDHRLFQNRNFPILCFVCLVDGMLLLGVNVLYSQEIAALFTTNATRIAVILSPYLITSTVGCLPAGWVMGRTQSYRVLLVAALAWCALFTGQ